VRPFSKDLRIHWFRPATFWALDKMRTTAIGTEHGVFNEPLPAIIMGLKKDGSASIGENNNRVSIVEITDSGKCFTANDKDVLVGARRNELLADLKAVNKPSTCRLNVEC
jgi:hypothetical protein